MIYNTAINITYCNFTGNEAGLLLNNLSKGGGIYSYFTLLKHIHRDL